MFTGTFLCIHQKRLGLTQHPRLPRYTASADFNLKLTSLTSGITVCNPTTLLWIAQFLSLVASLPEQGNILGHPLAVIEKKKKPSILTSAAHKWASPSPISPGLNLSWAHLFLRKLFSLFLYECAGRTMNFCTGEELRIEQSHARKPQTLKSFHTPQPY